MEPDVTIVKGYVPEMPEDANPYELGILAVQMLGMETLWSLVCVINTAERMGKDVSVSAQILGEEDDAPAYDPMKDIREWHDAVNETPFIERDEDGRGDLGVLRGELIYEETEEVLTEFRPLWARTGDFSRERLAMELADLLYVTYGTADLFDIPLYEVFKLVHAKNMEKVDPETGKVTKREDGKILKPAGFQPLTEEDVRAVIG